MHVWPVYSWVRKPDAALATVAAVKGKGWAAYAQDIRGDALLQKGDVKGAQEAYTTGIQSEGAGLSNPL